MQFLFYVFLCIAALYGLLIAFLYFFQRHLIYHPENNIGAPEKYGLQGFVEHAAKTPDNQTIQLWHRAAGSGFPTIVYYHGNAGHIGERAGIYDALARRGFGLLAVSYRGYGKSTGIPSEAGLYTDARTAITFLSQQGQVRPSDIILFGESLGTGVAVQMALEFEVGMLVLQAPYRSVAARAAELYAYVPVLLLIKDKYHTLQKISSVKAPLLVFHGERDEIIPIAHGRSVLEAATSPKHAFFFPRTGHNDFDSGIISEHVLDFAKKYNLIKP